MSRKNLFDEIACVAYDLYEKRGKAHGSHLEDWVEAEKIVMERHATEIEAEADIIKKSKVRKASVGTKSKTRKTVGTKKKTTTRRKKTE